MHPHRMTVILTAFLLAFLAYLVNFSVTVHDDGFFHDAAAVHGLSSDDTANVRDYVLARADLRVAMSVREQQHLSDVRHRMQQAQDALLVLVVLIISLFVVMWRSATGFGDVAAVIKRVLRMTSLVVLSMSALLLFAATRFTTAFALMHQPFFLPDSWLFSADSVLITLFPESFFYAYFRQVALATFLQGLAVFLLSFFPFNGLTFPFRRRKPHVSRKL